MRVPVGAAGEAGRDHRLAERLERARDVDPLAARHGGLLDRAMATPEPEVGHREGLVDRRVEGDGDDHAIPLDPSWRRRRRTARRRRRTNCRLASASALRITTISVRPSRSSPRCQHGGLRDRRARHQRHARDRPPAPADLDRPHPRARGQRAVELARARRARGSAGAPRAARCARRCAAATSCACSSRWASLTVANGLPLAHRRDAVVAAQAVADERQRVGVARRLAGLVEDDRDDRDARSWWPSPRGCSPRVEVWPVLTPLTSGTARTSRLRLRIVRGCDAACAASRAAGWSPRGRTRCGAGSASA